MTAGESTTGRFRGADEVGKREGVNFCMDKKIEITEAEMFEIYCDLYYKMACSPMGEHALHARNKCDTDKTIYDAFRSFIAERNK